MPGHISLDFETFYSKKLKYGLTTQIAEQYCRSPLFDPYMLSVSDGTTTWAGPPKDFNWSALDGKVLVSHNKYFDCSVYNEMVRRGWAPQINIAGWECTANLTAYICNRRALAQAVEHLYKIKLNKAVREDASGRRWPLDFSPEAQKEMLEYARSDAHWCWKLWNDYSPQWPEHEQRLSNLTIDQGMRGVQIDRPLLDNYILWTHDMKTATEKLLPWLSDDGEGDDDWNTFDAKPTSIKCISEQCRRSGIPCPPIKAHEGEEAYAEWESTYGKTNPWIPALSSWRSVNKLYKTFLTIKERLRDDGTLPFALKYFGAITGRWAGDAKINFQNFRKKPVLCNEFGLMETNENRESGDWVRHSIDIRKLIIPRPGKKMILSDLSQIEPRVLAYLSGNTGLLDYVKTGMSIYEAFARANMGYTGGKMDKASIEYALFKAQVLALGYGAGWEKFLTMAPDYVPGLDLTADDPEWVEVPDPVTGEMKQVSGYGQRAKQIVAGFREQNKLTVGMWKALDESFKRSIGSDFTMTLPSGRKMKYEGVKCEWRMTVDPETRKPRRKSVFTADVGGRRSEFYGGKFTAELVQATARDIFACHLLKLQGTPGVTVLFSAHDEAITEVDDNITPRQIEEIMCECPEWVAGLPLAAEAKKVERYEK